MSSARDRDLERWEHGALSMSELLALHGSDGAAGLVAFHRRMSALGAAPVGDPERTWRAIRERLPVRVHHRRTGSLRRRLTRPLAIAAAAVLIAGTAYASSPESIQRSLTSFWNKVQAILDVDVAGKVPADADRPLKGGPNGDGTAGAVDDALEDRDDGEADDEDGSGGISDGDGSEAEGDDENGSDGDGEGPGADGGDGESDEPGDDGDEPEGDGDDEPEDDEPEDNGDEPEGEDEDD